MGQTEKCFCIDQKLNLFRPGVIIFYLKVDRQMQSKRQEQGGGKEPINCCLFPHLGQGTGGA